ncbi:ABC transporter permease [Ruania halotolerans]|uniref:ABC transporter permease n=1 Tax=Ruania halotolerans TaxID=2897773 RepID=UPI001E314561|nr:ABC transporter permease [Ruania halotolerans]UFU05342.1 ABC transporter permease [Ruania halotolerans]
MSAAVEIHRPGLRAWRTLVVCEAKMVARDTAGLIVPLGLPLLILLMSSSGATAQVVQNGRTALEVFVLPLALTIVIAMIAIVNMPSFLASYRRTGILRRLAVTPASPALVLVAQLIVSLIQAALGIGLAIAVAVLAFGARAPENMGAAIGSFLLASLAMYSMGMVVASVAPTPNSAVAIGLVAFFALGALGGMFGGPNSLPEALETVGHVLPFGGAVQSLGAAWVGAPLEMAPLIGMVVTTVLGFGISATLFRWE